MAADIIHFDYSIDVTRAEDGAKEIVRRLRPTWDLQTLKFKQFTGGISNALLGCYLPDAPDDIILVRIYGYKSELIIDREAEKETFVLLNGAGCSAPLYCTFNNGMAYGFLKGVPLDEKMVRDENIRVLIAREMAKLHSLKKASPVQTGDGEVPAPKPYIYTKIQNFLNIAPDSDGFPDPERQKLYKKELGSKAALQSEFDMLRSHLEKLDCDVVFSHNDLLLQNIVFDKDANKVGFIDYEYAFYNVQAFDLGNHFNEYAGVDEVDYKRYPDKEYQLTWIRTYLTAYREIIGCKASVTDHDVLKLYVQANKCALCSHFFWGVWALIQAKNSKIDFDYLEYAVIRFKEYFARRDGFLALKEPMS